MDHRSLAILNHLVQTESYVTIHELAQRFNVSRRTIYNDLSKINDWLRENSYPEVGQIRGRGLYLEEIVKENLGTQLYISDYSYYEYSPEERRSWIFVFITINEYPLFLNDFIELFQVSRNTILEDIKTIKKELNDHRLVIESGRYEGYTVKGEENDVRRVLIHYLTFVTPESGWHQVFVDLEEADKLKQKLPRLYSVFNIHDLRLLKNLLIEYEKMLQIEFTDEILDNLVIWYYFF